MAAGRRSFRPGHRLRRSRDYIRVSRDGRRLRSAAFVLLVAPQPGDEASEPRLGITVGRRVGKATERNRVKRCVREWFRARREALPWGTDLVVIARPPARALAGPEIARELDALIREERGGQWP